MSAKHKASSKNVVVTNNQSKKHSKPSDDTKELTKSKVEQQLAVNADIFNKKYASVFIGNKHRILAQQSERNRIVYRYFTQSDFIKGFQNTLIVKNTKGDTVNQADAWLKHSKCAVYRGGVGLHPVPYGQQSSLPKNYYNLWKGFAVEPEEIESDTFHLIKDHIVKVLCGGDKELAEYFIKWVAYTIQHPDKPAGVATIVRGRKGTGKGIIGHFLRSLWGNHGLHISSQKHLTGNFNAHLADVCFLFADEAFYNGDKQHEANLKALITEPVLMIEPKGIDALQQPNYLKIFMATNSDYVVSASNDERRFFLVDALDTYKGNQAYFKALAAACDDVKNQQLFLYQMLKIDLSNFNISDIPETKALKDQRYNSLNSAGKWFFECLKNGTMNCVGWDFKMATEAYFEMYNMWCNTNRIMTSERISNVALSTYFGKIGFKEDKNIVYEGRKVRGRIFGSLTNAIKMFTQYEKITLE
jgi:hypothetical protein